MVARGNSCIERPRLVEREICPDGDDSIQPAVETRDALKRPLDELMGRNAARPHRVGEHAKNCFLPLGRGGTTLSAATVVVSVIVVT